ncbi:putative cytochrome P450 [Thozetella sp. PMI_491]|nr:putative cytochrome P450 [Thozetella sp. PMI_491]
MTLVTYLVILGGFVAGFYVLRRRSTTSSLLLPPGPPPLPIIGNIHQMPKSHPWRQYFSWSKIYGPIVHLNLSGQPVIILSTSQVAYDILSKQGASSSDRPRLFLAMELACKGLNTLLMNYTEEFKRHQRLQISVLNPKMVVSYLPFQELESKQLLHDLLVNTGGAGTSIYKYFARTTASLIYTLFVGHRIRNAEDPLLVSTIKLDEQFFEFAKVGSHIVDLFPVLNNLPDSFAPWKRAAEAFFNQKSTFRLNNLQQGLDSNAWNISKHWKEAVERDQIDISRLEMAFGTSTVFDAALDTTNDTLVWFVIACITQDQGFVAKARKELDTVVGRERLPTFDDNCKLPYISAIVEELFRWRPVIPVGVPHVTDKEITYGGYRIPARSIIISNIWAIGREEEVYGLNTESFVPGRWLNTDESTGVSTLKNLRTPVFGYGRRICPGRHFARNLVWVIVARLLWAFNIEAGRSAETGEQILVDPIACTDGLVVGALPFRASFKPRGLWAQKLIMEECDTYGQDIEAMLNQIGKEINTKS